MTGDGTDGIQAGSAEVLRAEDEADVAAFDAVGCRPTGLLAVSRHARIHGVNLDGAPAILKCARAATMADPVERVRFAREGRIGLALRHPGLVETRAAGASWILLGDLRSDTGAPCPCLADRIPSSATLAALAPVAAALAYMHARGLVHQDVKPGNILFDARDRAVLVDLGIVGLVGGDPLGATELIGSPAWMAPEQLDGAAPAPAADAWSFAAVLTFALSGIPPYAGTADAVLARRQAGAGPAPGFRNGWGRHAETALGQLIAAGLADEPQQRPSLNAFAAILTEPAACLAARQP